MEGEVEEDIRGIIGDGRRLGVVSTQYSVQIMCCITLHLKPM